MRTTVLMMTLLMLGGCAGSNLFPQADQCMAPTPREAKITKKAWM